MLKIMFVNSVLLTVPKILSIITSFADKGKTEVRFKEMRNQERFSKLDNSNVKLNFE
jgi:hypothetical protein